MKQAVTMGSVMASFTCEAFGTAKLERLTMNEVYARWKEYTMLTACGPMVWPQEPH
jgi:hypothetical protein